MSSARFPGEPFLPANVPDYDLSPVFVAGWMILASAFWLVVFTTYFLANSVTTTATTTTIRLVKNGQKHSIRSQKAKPNRDKKVSPPLVARLVGVLASMATCLAILAIASPYNNWLPRRVFEAPLLTREECLEIVERSMAAARLNEQHAKAIQSNNTSAVNRQSSLLQEPVGWQKQRHGTYPTTDLNWVTDPFTDDDRAYMGTLLDRRLAPLLSRVYGIPEASLRCNDLFVVRYDASHRAHLDMHEDDGDISFNVLLNSEFAGGGTQFWQRVETTAEHSALEPFAHATPTEAGTVLTHSALLQHEGMPITEGTRLILVGFLAVDRTNPWTREPTGLSWLASFANVNWLTVQTKHEGFNKANRQRLEQRQASPSAQQHQQAWSDAALFQYLFSRIIKSWVDHYCPHTLESLVAPASKSRYLQALDEGYITPPRSQRATWFQGQKDYQSGRRKASDRNGEL